ncbi:MAG: methyl-accepting chemotaxis protein [Firmicutes bacterium]|nr:methyl-accepting chemotaxis protein [Bacillota bacterium]
MKSKIKEIFQNTGKMFIRLFSNIKIDRRLIIFTIFIITTIVSISSIIFINTYRDRVLQDEEEKLRETLQLVNNTLIQKKEEYKNYAGIISNITETQDILSGNGSNTILYDLMSNLGFSGLELRDSDFNIVNSIAMKTAIDKNIEKNILGLMNQNVSLGIYISNEDVFQITGISPIKDPYSIGAMGAVLVSQDISGSIFREISESLGISAQLYQGRKLKSNAYNTFDNINLIDKKIIDIFDQDNSPEYFIQGEMIKEINYMIGYVPIRGFSEEIVGYITLVSSLGNAYNMITAVMIKTAILSVIFIFIACILVYLITKSITIPLNNLVLATKDVAAGDLTKKLNLVSKDELGDLTKQFNIMIENLRKIISKISKSSNLVLDMSKNLSSDSEAVSAASQEVASASQGIAAGIDEEVLQTNKTMTILDTMNDIGKKVNESSVEVKNTVDEAYNNSKYGLEVIVGVSDSMGDILIEVNNTREELSDFGNKIEEINNIIKAINYINEQTSLLSLNATIEAARAGDAGRGFAVVADEIRQLAEKTSESVKEINNIFKEINDAKIDVIESINKSSQLVNKGEEEVNNVQYVFANISEAVEKSKKAVDKINDFIEEQSTGTKNIEEAVNNINTIAASNAGDAKRTARVNKEQVNIIEDIAGAADDLSLMADELQKMVKQFTIS